MTFDDDPLNLIFTLYLFRFVAIKVLLLYIHLCLRLCKTVYVIVVQMHTETFG